MNPDLPPLPDPGVTVTTPPDPDPHCDGLFRRRGGCSGHHLRGSDSRTVEYTAIHPDGRAAERTLGSLRARRHDRRSRGPKDQARSKATTTLFRAAKMVPLLRSRGGSPEAADRRSPRRGSGPASAVLWTLPRAATLHTTKQSRVIDVIVDVIVIVIVDVIDPVIVAVHVHGNATVIVILPVVAVVARRSP